MDGGCVATSSASTELAYVTLNSAPDMIYFGCKPKEAHRSDESLAYDADLTTWNGQFQANKGVNMEITGIDMSINTSSNVLN